MIRVAFLALLALPSCAAPTIVARPSVPSTPRELRCRGHELQERPLVTEWPAAEKANLESAVREGGVVVNYVGCSLTVLPQCRVRAPYLWVRTTPSTDSLEIENEDELYAKLPLGAAALEGELQGSGRLVVETTVSGQLRLDGAAGTFPQVEGDCGAATHIVGGISIGAFQLRAGGTSSGRAEAEVKMVGSARAKSTASELLIRRAGDPASCGSATDQAPDASCASPLQMFLLPIGAASGQPLASAARPYAGGSGGPLSVQFLSADPDRSWDVVVDGRRACVTPCTQEIAPSRSLLMRERSSFLTRRSRLTVSDLHRWGSVGGVQIRAHTTSTWNLSGLTRMGGIFYGIIGAGFLVPCFVSDDPDDRDRFCAVGGITLGLGAALFAVGTWVLDSPGRAETSPLSGSF